MKKKRGQMENVKNIENNKNHNIQILLSSYIYICLIYIFEINIFEINTPILGI